jgi:hypothetical protein
MVKNETECMLGIRIVANIIKILNKNSKYKVLNINFMF